MLAQINIPVYRDSQYESDKLDCEQVQSFKMSRSQ